MSGRNGGRKPIPIDVEEFEKLCEIQCTLIEIAGWFRVTEDTIERWCKRHYKKDFAEVFRAKRQKGRISLRRKQMQTALNGNVPLMIWLGKQYLGQSEKFEQKVDSTNKIQISKIEEDL